MQPAAHKIQAYIDALVKQSAALRKHMRARYDYDAATKAADLAKCLLERELEDIARKAAES